MRLGSGGRGFRVSDGAFERGLDVEARLPGGFRVCGDSLVDGVCGGHGEGSGLDLGPGGAFEVEEVFGEFESHRRILRRARPGPFTA